MHEHSLLFHKWCKQVGFSPFRCRFASFLIFLAHTPLPDARFLEAGTIFFIFCLSKDALKRTSSSLPQVAKSRRAASSTVEMFFRCLLVHVCVICYRSIWLQTCAELASFRVKCCWNVRFFLGEPFLKTLQGAQEYCRCKKKLWAAVKVLIRCPWQVQLLTHKCLFMTLKSNWTVQGPCRHWSLVGTCVMVLNKRESPWVSPTSQRSGEAEPTLGLRQPVSLKQEKTPEWRGQVQKGTYVDISLLCYKWSSL